MSTRDRTEHHSAIGLREAFGDNLAIGCALGGSLPEALDESELALLLKHFSVVTPENCMKPEPIHPRPGAFDFEHSDRLVSFAERHQMAVVGHCLSWHQQSPDWFYAGKSRAEALAQLHEHIAAVAGRYRGRLQGWDVVNEAIADREDGLKATPALEAIGPDHVLRAFEFAEQADPDAELYYNDYNIEQPGKRDRTLRLLEQLKNGGARVDGVGIQGHWLLDQVPFDDLQIAIEAYRQLDLKVMITELDVDVVERPDCGADVSVHRAYQPSEDIYREGCPAAVASRQAEQYARLFEIFSESKAVSRVTFWGLHDGRTWLNTWPGKRTNHPLLFDRATKPKACCDAVLEVARAGGRPGPPPEGDF
jgi:endo-1,4-beta-xylanase